MRGRACKPAPALWAVSFVVVATLLATLTPVSRAEDSLPAEGLPRADSAWFEGAAGFAEGLELAEAENQSVLVYFYADWCGYCRQLESNLLYTSDVEDYTKYLVKIRVNPEKGASERQLAGRYGVRGYPAVFVHSAASDRPQKVTRMVIDGGKRRLMTADEYVGRLAAATGSRFGS